MYTNFVKIYHKELFMYTNFVNFLNGQIRAEVFGHICICPRTCHGAAKVSCHESFVLYGTIKVFGHTINDFGHI